MFGLLKNTLQKIYSQVTSKMQGIFSRSQIDTQTLSELERILLEADTGTTTTRALIAQLKNQAAAGKLTTGAELKAELHKLLLQLLETKNYNPVADVYLLVGINGSGKTTCAGKLAHKFITQGKKVLFVAGDTFRAAATEQLTVWAQRLGADIIVGKENQDPASVIFTACEHYRAQNYDILIIDTAGRLQTKLHLMKELEKVRRIITRQLPDKQVSTLLTVDSMLGQNSLEQAKVFHESTQLDGIILTKMDGTGKGGIVFAIVQELKIPIAFISFGENPEQFALFNAQNYVSELLQS